MCIRDSLVRGENRSDAQAVRGRRENGSTARTAGERRKPQLPGNRRQDPKMCIRDSPMVGATVACAVAVYEGLKK